MKKILLLAISLLSAQSLLSQANKPPVHPSSVDLADALSRIDINLSKLDHSLGTLAGQFQSPDVVQGLHSRTTAIRDVAKK